MSVGKAIRAAEKDKVPVMCVIGPREAAAGLVAVRTHAGGDLGSMPAKDFHAQLAAAIAHRTDFCAVKAPELPPHGALLESDN